MSFTRLRLAALALCCALAGTACGGGGGGGAGVNPTPPPPVVSPPPPPPAVSGAGPFIVVDQFGYRPADPKIAVLRDPVTGFDASDAFAPGATYQVIDAATNAVVLTGAPVQWKAGATDTSSGDRAWRFDFSAVTTPGEYFVRDVDRALNSARFQIKDDVYRPILVAAMRTFFYQRAGAAKPAALAGAQWADGASHLGPLQDANARLYSAPNDASTERDLRGGWYDAGDPNKYTNWAGDYIIRLLHAYRENPGIWTDDYNIPESGNGVPDILDEVKWKLDWLVRMQEPNGSVLSVMGLADGSPPSAATGPSLYGSASTSATLSAAAAYAVGAKVFGGVPGFASYAADLEQRAKNAWAWAIANPNVIFRNNDAAAGTQGLAAGQQEVNDYGRGVKKTNAAVYLFDLTGEAQYKSVVDADYDNILLFTAGWASPHESDAQRPLLYYASLPGATPAVASDIRAKFVAGMNNSADQWPAINSDRDPYLAHIQEYLWGSNGLKARQGAMYADLAYYGLSSYTPEQARAVASHFLHYLHGVNPLGKVYMSNMASYGAENSAPTFYHFWYRDGSALWDDVRTSTYGPPPGYITGGPNPTYKWDNQCPANPLCPASQLSPPTGQPDQKSYADFNTSWPLNSWEVTENYNGYQTDYVLLLARFVK